MPWDSFRLSHNRYRGVYCFDFLNVESVDIRNSDISKVMPKDRYWDDNLALWSLDTAAIVQKSLAVLIHYADGIQLPSEIELYRNVFVKKVKISGSAALQQFPSYLFPIFFPNVMFIQLHRVQQRGQLASTLFGDLPSVEVVKLTGLGVKCLNRWTFVCRVSYLHHRLSTVIKDERTRNYERLFPSHKLKLRILLKNLNNIACPRMNLRVLEIISDTLEWIEHGVFEIITNLHSIKISSTKLSYLPESLNELKFLSQIDLRGSYRIKTLAPKFWSPLFQHVSRVIFDHDQVLCACNLDWIQHTPKFSSFLCGHNDRSAFLVDILSFCSSKTICYDPHLPNLHIMFNKFRCFPSTIGYVHNSTEVCPESPTWWNNTITVEHIFSLEANAYMHFHFPVKYELEHIYFFYSSFIVTSPEILLPTIWLIFFMGMLTFIMLVFFYPQYSDTQRSIRLLKRLIDQTTQVPSPRVMQENVKPKGTKFRHSVSTTKRIFR